VVTLAAVAPVVALAGQVAIARAMPVAPAVSPAVKSSGLA
jgi:hypothetical protein